MKLCLCSFILFCLCIKSFHFYEQLEGSYFVEEFFGSLSKNIGILFTADGPTTVSAVLACKNRCGGDRRCIGIEVCKIRENLHQCRACCSWKKKDKEKANTNEDSCSYFHLENDDRTGYINVAHGKPASMSSVGDNTLVPGNAVDNVVECPTSRGFLAHSASEYNPWLRIDLQHVFDVLSVLIFARQDCCENGRFKNAMVTVSDDAKNHTCGFYPGPTNLGDQIIVLCKSDARGRFVTVTLQSEPGTSTIFQVCEIQVFGKQLSL